MTVEAARTAAACVSSVYFLPVGLLQFVVLWSAGHSSVANADCPAAMWSLLLRGGRKGKRGEERRFTYQGGKEGGLLLRGQKGRERGRKQGRPQDFG